MKLIIRCIFCLMLLPAVTNCSSDDPRPTRSYTRQATPRTAEIVDGKTLAERKVIFGTVAQLQDRAACDAQDRYPGDYVKQAEYSNAKDVEAYETAAQIHEIEVDQVRRIVVEGARALWPMRDHPCVLR